MFDLPCDDGSPVPIPLDDMRDERRRSPEQRLASLWRDERAFAQGLSQVMLWNEKLRIAERLHSAHIEDDLLSRSLTGLDLPVERIELKAIRRSLDAVPVGAQADQLEGV